jgi:hypothetical protein
MLGVDILGEKRDSKRLPSDRVRTVGMAIEREAPECMHRRLSKAGSKGPVPVTLVESLNATLNYIHGEATIHGQKIPRNILLSPSKVIGYMTAYMRDINHPVTQALDEVGYQFIGKIDHQDILKLEAEVLLSTQELLIIDIYRLYCAQFKKVAGQNK